MNKKVINNNKEAFDYWLKGKKIWRRDCNVGQEQSLWALTSSPLWNDTDITYIQDDEYAELRKAGADGKQLQVSYDDGSTWYGKQTRKISWSSSQLVRIKPDKPQFKIGDWVLYLGNDGIGSVQPRGQIIEVCQDGRICSGNIGYAMPSSMFALWEPEVGEWCWFWNKPTCQYPQLGKYMQHTSQGVQALVSCNSYNDFTDYEPFIGSLPTHGSQ